MRTPSWILVVLSCLVVLPASGNEHGGEEVLAAVRAGDNTRVRELIASGAELDARDEFGVTPLMEAVRLGDAATVHDLLEAGADPDAEDDSGDNALRIAARENRPAAAILLLGADAHTEGVTGPPSALIDAMVAADDQAFDTLLKSGEQVTAFALITAYRRSIRWYRALANHWMSAETPSQISPRKIVDVTPAFPEDALAQGIQGTVTLRAEIDAQGNVTGVEVVDSIPELDHAAIEAVAQWKYEPTRLHGVPIPVEVTVQVTFSVNALGLPVVRQRLKA